MNGNAGVADAWADAGAAWSAAMWRGDFAAAWQVSDAVIASRDPRDRDDPRLPYHLRWVWDGSAPDGRHVLVRCYHGLGDTLQFCRYLPILGARSASLSVEVQPELLPLLRALPGVDRWIAFDHAAPVPVPAGGLDLEIMELAHALREIPDGAPYLPVPDAAGLRNRLGSGLLVGACWQAGDWSPTRSMRLNTMRTVLDRPGLTPVLLQRGPAAAEALEPQAPRFANPHDRSMDILDTAALLAAVDRVVTVDTMVAHLAGALGRPAAVLLHADPDWRWPVHAGHNPWYPTLRLFRQQRDGDWSEPLDRVRGWLSRPLLPAEGRAA